MLMFLKIKLILINLCQESFDNISTFILAIYRLSSIFYLSCSKILKTYFTYIGFYLAKYIFKKSIAKSKNLIVNKTYCLNIPVLE